MTNDFLRGALCVAFAVAGLFFLRFWRLAAERLFLLFALAFWFLALESIGLALVRPPRESQHYFYVLRLIAFALIIAGVIDKNRGSRR